jgi:hypothetical protein
MNKSQAAAVAVIGRRSSCCHGLSAQRYLRQSSLMTCSAFAAATARWPSLTHCLAQMTSEIGSL